VGELRHVNQFDVNIGEILSVVFGVFGKSSCCDYQGMAGVRGQCRTVKFLNDRPPDSAIGTVLAFYDPQTS
jgi:hypothetical protein